MGRPRLLLLAGRYRWRQKNAVASTLAWMTAERHTSFEVYYDIRRAGRHYGGGATGPGLLASPGEPDGQLAGGLVTGARHLEALSVALQRFQATVICTGEVAFSNTLAALADDSDARVLRADEEDTLHLYEEALSELALPWPTTAVMVNAAPAPELDGVDAYLWPEIFHRRALGLELSADPGQVQALLERGVRRVLTCGVPPARQEALAAAGFEVEELHLLEPGDDLASFTARLARRWSHERQGWMLGDPMLASCWLPTACRERRAVIFGRPQSRAIELLHDEIGRRTTPAVLGRQQSDRDFFELSRLGQSFQLVDPGRPPLPILLTRASRWSPSLPDPDAEDPSDEQLREWAREGRVLTSLVFWTGMLRETENLFALVDLAATTGLRGGLALTTDSLASRPSPLELLSVPRDQGGVYPHLEILLASCGTGAAIESLLDPQQLGQHLAEARRGLERIGLPPTWWPQGWWATMDAPLVPWRPGRSPRRVRWNPASPYGVEFRFRDRGGDGADPANTAEGGRAGLPRRVFTAAAEGVRGQVRERVRGRRLRTLFNEYRPYERYSPGPVDPGLAGAVREAGFTYMLSKSGFREPPRVLLRDREFVALNYTAGQWDGWTPFETINGTGDLRQAERRLLSRGQPGWLLGTVDACLWAFSGELWERAPQLADMGRFLAGGGRSGRLLNVTPRVVARYARLLDGPGDAQ